MAVVVVVVVLLGLLSELLPLLVREEGLGSQCLLAVVVVVVVLLGLLSVLLPLLVMQTMLQPGVVCSAASCVC